MLLKVVRVMLAVPSLTWFLNILKWPPPRRPQKLSCPLCPHLECFELFFSKALDQPSPKSVKRLQQLSSLYLSAVDAALIGNLPPAQDVLAFSWHHWQQPQALVRKPPCLIWLFMCVALASAMLLDLCLSFTQEVFHLGKVTFLHTMATCSNDKKADENQSSFQKMRAHVKDFVEASPEEHKK